MAQFTTCRVSEASATELGTQNAPGKAPVRAQCRINRMRFVDASVYQLVVSYYVSSVDFEKINYYDQIKSYVSYRIQSNLFV